MGLAAFHRFGPDAARIPHRGCGRHALIQVEATGKLVFRWRDKVGPDESRVKELGQVTLPLHLRLTRAGRQIQIFTSADGQSWGEPLMTHSTTFDGQSPCGLFVCSGNTFASTTTRCATAISIRATASARSRGL